MQSFGPEFHEGEQNTENDSQEDQLEQSNANLNKQCVAAATRQRTQS